MLYFGRDNAYRAEYHMYKDPNGEYVIKGITPKSAEVHVHPLSFDGIVARWKELEEYVEKKEVPPRDYKAVLSKDGTVTDKRVKNGVEYKTDKACLYCSYKTTCWSLSDKEKDAYQVGRQ
jgi:hypothetical protein